MKKLMSSLLLVFGIALSTTAQRATLMPLIAGDTIINTGTVSKSFPATAGYSAVGVQILVAKISGTVAGTATFQGSLNGSNWETIGSAFTLTDVASQAKAFTQTGGSPYTSYRILFTGSGTMSAQARVYFVLRKHD